MFWVINYVVNNSYDCYRRVCIINADNKEGALEAFHTKIESKLRSGNSIIHECTEVLECNDPVILYDGYK